MFAKIHVLRRKRRITLHRIGEEKHLKEKGLHSLPWNIDPRSANVLLSLDQAEKMLLGLL